jgi:uncharacterized protein YkwD
MQKGEKKRRARGTLARLFLPHESNSFHPHFLRTTPVAATLAVVAVMQVAFFTYQLAFLSSGPHVASILPAAIALLTNEARTEEGVTPLAVNATLTEAAQKKADDMVARSYFAHKEPTGEMPWHWFLDNGYVYSHAGENLAVNFTDTRQLVDAWLASPTHRENIVRTQYTDIGIGMATGTYKGREAVFVVQFFGRPKDVAQRVVPPDTTTVARTAPSGADVADVEVLGEETVAPEEPAQTWLQKIKASPRTLNAHVLIAFMVVLGVAFAFTLTSTFRAHPRAILNGFLLLAVIVSLWAYQDAFFGQPELPEDSQAAAVSLST